VKTGSEQESRVRRRSVARSWRASLAATGIVTVGLMAALPLSAGASAVGGAPGSAPSSSSAPAATPDLTAGTHHFVDVSTTANTGGDGTSITPAVKNANAVVFVTPVLNASSCGCTTDPAPLGVYWNGSSWVIFNEDESAMSVGMLFDVLVVPKPTTRVFKQTASASNSSSDSMFINSSLTNGNPKAQIQVTQNWSPDDVFNDISVGVWYDTSNSQWAVFNETGAAMTMGATFNIILGVAPSGGGTAHLQKTAKANELTAGVTYVNSPVTNSDNSAFALVTPLWNPSGTGGVFDTVPVGMVVDNFSSETEIGIFAEDNSQSSLPLKSAFNTILFSS
jgi:hypothetical protein